MAEQIILKNNSIITQTKSDKKFTVIEGTLYLFAVKKLDEQHTGARNEIGVYNSGDTIPAITGNDTYSIILTGKNSILEESPVTEQEKADFDQLNSRIIENLVQEEKRLLEASILQQELSDEIYSKSLRNISSVTNPENVKNDYYDVEDSTIVKAFKIVAAKMNLTTKSIPGREYTSSKTGIFQLAKDNTIRVREVILNNNWYEKDNGHLIAFYNKESDIELSDDYVEYDFESNCTPVALLKTRKGYIMINPDNENDIKITRDNAARIYPKAFMLYKSLPDEKIKIKEILKFVFSDIKFDILRFILISLMCTLIGLVTPEITRNFVDYVIPNAAKNQALLITVMVVVVNLSSMVGNLSKSLASLRMETRSTNALDSAVIDRMLKLPVNFFKDYSSGDLSDRISGIGSIQKQIFSIFMSVAMNFAFCFIYLIQEIRYCSYFAGWGALFCLFPIIISTLSCFVTYKLEKQLLQCGGKVAGMLLQFLNGIEKITNSNSHKRVFAQFEQENIRQVKIGYKMSQIQNIFGLFNVIFPTFVSIMFYYLYGKAIATNRIEGLSTGTFMAFLSAYGSFQGAILGITGSLLDIRNLLPMGKRVSPILQTQPEIEVNKPSVSSLKGNIEINHLNFRYNPDGPLILKDINISVKTGEFVAIVGSSGAGKSTLLRMLLGFEKPESGSIFYDDQDINSFDIGSIRRQMGVVLQNDTVLAGSILQNIVGSSGKSESEAWDAARKVAFDRDIADMPMGMYTMIPAGGLSLSGGQLQRLIIARAIIRNPNVLIFDEATSALDNITQSVVRQSLDELNVTRIVIAHRLSTIINADRIYVMKDGAVIETGNYNELMDQKGWFYQMALRQKI